MRKNLKTIAAIFAAGTMACFMASCSKEYLDTTNLTIEYGPERPIEVSARIATGACDKAYMDIASYKVIWDDGDVINVNNATLSMLEIDPDDPTHAKFEGSASPNTYLESDKDVYRSVYPASIITSIPASAAPMVVNLPAAQTFTGTNPSKVLGNYMAAYTSVPKGSGSMTFHYKNLCSVIKIVLTPQSGASGVDNQISRIRIASTEGLSGSFNVTFSNGEPVLAAVDANPVNVVDKIYSVPLELSATYTIYAFVPPIANKSLVLQIWNGDGTRVIEKQATSATLERSRVHTVTINQAFEDWGKTYSVDANQRVYFAHGNLKYHFTNDQWRFFDEQYGMCTKTEVENTLSTNVSSEQGEPYYVNATNSDNQPAWDRANYIHTLSQWTDHFNFGTSGEHATGNAFRYPWHTFYGISLGIMEGNGYAYGPWDNNASQDLTGAYANADWGVNNRTELNNSLTPVAGDWRTQRGDWRTPTQSEWYYCINGSKRIDVDNSYRYGKARIEVSSGNYVNGLMMIPDKWHWFLMPEALPFTPGTGGYESNTYTLAQWDVLDRYGAVFLPAAGSRLHIVEAYGDEGFYQSASCAKNVVPGVVGWNTPNQRAYSLYFTSQVVNSPNGATSVFNKIDGHTVRLVRNTNDQ